MVTNVRDKRGHSQVYEELDDAQWHISDEEIAVKFIGNKLYLVSEVRSWSVR